MNLIERLRTVKWEVTNDGDRMPDDPTHKCVFVDMRPDDFRALLHEAASALEAEREDTERWRWFAPKLAEKLGKPIHEVVSEIDAALAAHKAHHNPTTEGKEHE